MEGRFGGTWRAWVWECEVTVAHEGEVVVLVVGQEGCRIVVVLVVEWRTWSVVERL